MSEQDEEKHLIPPRTTKERQAFLQGWMDAVEMVDKEGLAAARQWMAEMAALELQMMERRAQQEQ